jgi:hypothetical protein
MEALLLLTQIISPRRHDSKLDFPHPTDPENIKNVNNKEINKKKKKKKPIISVNCCL